MWQSFIEYVNYAGTSAIDYIKRVREYGWPVALELLLIGLVIYAVLRFLQSGRGLRLMRGLVVILVTVFLILKVFAERLHLDRISVLAEPLLYVIFLGSLIVFQPELRRALIQVGEASWLRRFIRESKQTISPIVSAVRYFSTNKIGAIIALERQVGLDPIAESGVKLNAALSSELLRTIFWPGSALHDLGVIIREERIAAAACQFPLTDSEQVDPSLGSRHRAAVGLSEETDAVVVAVSEETGIISLAVDGRLHRGLTPEDLERKLTELMEVADKKQLVVSSW